MKGTGYRVPQDIKGSDIFSRLDFFYNSGNTYPAVKHQPQSSIVSGLGYRVNKFKIGETLMHKRSTTHRNASPDVIKVVSTSKQLRFHVT